MTQAQFLAIVANEEVIAVDQDSLCVQGKNVTAASGSELRAGVQGKEVWAKRLSDNGTSIAVLFMNAAAGNKTLNVTASWEQIGLTRTPGRLATVRDLWAKKDLPGTFQDSFTAANLAHHDCRMLKITLVEAT